MSNDDAYDGHETTEPASEHGAEAGRGAGVGPNGPHPEDTDLDDPDAGSERDDELADAAEAMRMRRFRAIHARLDDLTAVAEHTRENHAYLSSYVSETLAPSLDNLGTTVEDELEQLRQAVKEILVEQAKTENPPVDWAQLSADAAAVEWPILARWVGEVLVPTYELTRAELPDCWALHGPVVLELSWLRSAHVQSYLRGTHPHITAEWHTRWRPVALARIKELISEPSCRPGEHMIPKEESQAQRRAPGGPDGAAPRPAGRAPRSQPAEPEHWWPFYQRAYHADLSRRRARRMSSDADWVPDPISGTV